MVEEVAEVLLREGWGIASGQRGVFIDTSTPATIEVGLVTISGRTGSTTSIGDVGLVITLNLVVAKTGDVIETTIISPTGSAGSVIGSAAIISSATLESLAGSRLVRRQVAIQDIQLCNIHIS